MTTELFEINCKYTALKPCQVEITAREIASNIYESDKVSPKYTNTIVALRNLCVNETNHYHLDNASYKCFLETLRPVITAQSADDCTPPVSTICDHLQSLHTFRTKLLRRQDEIRKHYQEDNASSAGGANRHAALGECLEIVKAIKIQTVPSRPVKDPVLQGDQVGLVYALLNVSHADELLTGILLNWAARPGRSPEEKACLEYVWHNFDTVGETVRTVLFDNFVYVVEKMIIRYCTEVLQSGCQPLSMLRTEDRKVRNCIRSIIYTLFVYSRCNRKIFEILKLFE
ncbi:uncharacterized protein LOC116161228 [Photinus pyralis]|uniref:Uncharacterized protein n=1 Tax=Photinus pyralis TaxID=7054 RepID=A0A1Y1LBB8_PHOPY|nr:uncharacterized protein LOC116161228 [Photinus pyralis]